jgi:hypothetical protein
MTTIAEWMTAVLLLVATATAAAADGDLGHKVLGAVGLDAGTQPERGVYAANRFFWFSADRLRDRHGDRIPVRGFDLGAYANVTGISATVKPKGAPYLGAALAIPVAWLHLRTDLPPAAVDRFGLGDVFVEPLKVGWRLPRLDVVASYSFYAPTGQADRQGLGRPQWSHQFSTGGTLFFDAERRFRLSALASYNLYHKKIGIDVTRGDSVQLQGGLGASLLRMLDVGVAGYALRQVADDRGSDLPLALRGAREQVFGLGPEIGITIAPLRARVTARYEWDLGAKARPEGRVLVVSLSVLGWRPS